MICFLISAFAAFTAYHLTFLKPKWLQFASDPTFPQLAGQKGYWSIRGQFELLLWLSGINRAARGCTFFEQALAVAVFIVSAMLGSIVCHTVSGALK